jgi:hypothetical protein
MKEAHKREYVAWLEEYWWRWIGVLTFREGIRVRRARTLLREWLSVIQADEGHRISYVAVLELGSETDHLHFHIMLAGIASRLAHYLPLWEQMAGGAKLAPFRSAFVRSTPDGLKRSSGIAYALKSLVNEDYDFEIELRDEHRLPRYRIVAERSQSAFRSRCTEQRLRKPQDRCK